jgi:phospholipid/cholesterol/gamma-HCH transport system substrate-binding protein
MKRHRTLINVLTFVVASMGLVYYGGMNLIIQQADGPKLAAEFQDAAGLLPRNDVTMRGVVVGTVGDVRLTATGVIVDMTLNPGTEVPTGTHATIVRRSPIGELTMELEPGDGEPMPDGAVIDSSDTTAPPDVSTTIESLADVLHAVPSEDLSTVVEELALAVDGRAADLQRFTDASAALPERLLEVERELYSLIRTGPKLTGVFADNAPTFADDLRQTALLADILRDKRFDLVDLYREGARFSQIAGDLLADEKANLSCFISDAGVVNAAIADRKRDIAATLDKNQFFFGGVEQTVQKDREGYTWFRVQLLPHTEPQGRIYEPKRPAPDVFPGRKCTSRYGDGVSAALQGNAVLAPDSFIRK